MAKTFFITTAIDYTNSAPHIGHAYEKILADVIARYHRLKREDVFFMTGVDQHGQKVQQSAEKEGVPPEEFVAGVTEQFIALWDKLDVRYDAWAATTDPLHKKCVQGMLERLHGQGKIYKDKQVGFYSVRQEQFLTDKDRNAAGEFGPEWGEVEEREEENYYFKLEEHKKWLLDFIDKRSEPDWRSEPDGRTGEKKPFVVPDFRVAELRNAVEKLSGDLCISRPKSRLSWGIELPFDRDYVNYVWFDALSNYISFAGYDPTKSFDEQPAEFRARWPALHVIGKDILVPAHGIYWPIMLHALGFPDEQMPILLVHGWWNVSGAKMSKSLGNVIDPDALIDKYGAEALRYYLMSDIVTGKDADFSEERLVARYDADLANSLGNLVNRTLNMAQRYRAGYVRCANDTPDELFRIMASGGQISEDHMASLDSDTRQVALGLADLRLTAKAVSDSVPAIAPFSLNECLATILSLVSKANLRVETSAPWKLAKQSDLQLLLDTVLYYLAESLRIIAILISPVLPKAAHGIFDQLNWKMELSGKEERFSLADAEWGQLPDGHVVGRPVPLFPRIEG